MSVNFLSQFRVSGGSSFGQLMLFFLIASLMGTPANAQSPCLYPSDPWSCFGSFELRLKGKEGSQVQVAQMIRFTNGEFMFEMERQGTRKQLLRVLPSGLELLSGLSEDESPEVGPKNPFMFQDLLFAYPFMSLRLAYPSGPASVSETATKTAIVVENKYPATVTATRLGPERIGFHLSMDDGRIPPMDVVWDGKLNKPLPDDMPLTNWKQASGTTPPDLGQARSSTKQDSLKKNGW